MKQWLVVGLMVALLSSQAHADSNQVVERIAGGRFSVGIDASWNQIPNWFFDIAKIDEYPTMSGYSASVRVKAYVLQGNWWALAGVVEASYGSVSGDGAWKDRETAAKYSPFPDGKAEGRTKARMIGGTIGPEVTLRLWRQLAFVFRIGVGGFDVEGGFSGDVSVGEGGAAGTSQPMSKDFHQALPGGKVSGGLQVPLGKGFSLLPEAYISFPMGYGGNLAIQKTFQ
ncbi:MAG: hypothetical protein AAB691_02665 [Patescibacteria group bacterium]